MGTSTTTTVNVRPEQVFAVLADASAYPGWIVGAKHIRDADPDWPAPGTKFHHTVGVGPFTLRDNTKSLDADPPHCLVLEARVRPFGRARVEIRISSEAEHTRIDMTETITSPTLLRLLDPLFAPLVAARNNESLRRLRNLAEERAATR